MCFERSWEYDGNTTSQRSNRLNAPQRTTPPKAHRTKHTTTHIRIATTTPRRAPTPTSPHTTVPLTFPHPNENTCSAWSSSPFVLHTMRGTHDKVTCSRHHGGFGLFGTEIGMRMVFAFFLCWFAFPLNWVFTVLRGGALFRLFRSRMHQPLPGVRA